jgi:D-glycero-alpha-D-manno-heptose-7-phosphate kinase
VKFEAKSPTRVDLAGGTLDCWPLFLLVDSAITTNLSISIWTKAILEPVKGKEITISIRDLEFEKTFKNLDEVLQDKNEALDLLRAHLNYWRPKNGFRLTTSSQSPIGGGLGGSSSLCISLIKVFSRWQRVTLTLNETVTLASNLEAQILKKPTGTQDYFGALSTGLNAIHYTPAGAKLESLHLNADILNAQLTLVYTGKPHHSGLNNWAVLKQAMDRDPNTLAALLELKRVAQEVYSACQQGHWHALAPLFRQEYKARVALSEGFSSPEIRRLEDLVLKAGGDAVKICGAGGGGCVLVWSAPECKGKVEQACREAGFEILKAKVVVKLNSKLNSKTNGKSNSKLNGEPAEKPLAQA